MYFSMSTASWTVAGSAIFLVSGKRRHRIPTLMLTPANIIKGNAGSNFLPWINPINSNHDRLFTERNNLIGRFFLQHLQLLALIFLRCDRWLNKVQLQHFLPVSETDPTCKNRPLPRHKIWTVFQTWKM